MAKKTISNKTVTQRSLPSNSNTKTKTPSKKTKLASKATTQSTDPHATMSIVADSTPTEAKKSTPTTASTTAPTTAKTKVKAETAVPSEAKKTTAPTTAKAKVKAETAAPSEAKKTTAPTTAKAKVKAETAASSEAKKTTAPTTAKAKVKAETAAPSEAKKTTALTTAKAKSAAKTDIQIPVLAETLENSAVRELGAETADAREMPEIIAKRMADITGAAGIKRQPHWDEVGQGLEGMEDTDDPLERFSRVIAPHRRKSTHRIAKVEQSAALETAKDRSNQVTLNKQDSDVVSTRSVAIEEPKERSDAHSKQKSPQRPRSTPAQPRDEKSNLHQLENKRELELRRDEAEGLVRVRIFHPDVQPGGGYIETKVPRGQIPTGAIVVTSALDTDAETPNALPKNRKTSDLLGDGLPSGGIIEAGRRLMAEGRFSYKSATTPDAQSPQTQAAQTSVATDTTQDIAPAQTSVATDTTQDIASAQTPVATDTAQDIASAQTPVATDTAQDIAPAQTSVATGTAQDIASAQTPVATDTAQDIAPAQTSVATGTPPVRPPGLGNGFLTGLPGANTAAYRQPTLDAAKQALQSAFADPSSRPSADKSPSPPVLPSISPSPSTPAMATSSSPAGFSGSLQTLAKTAQASGMTGKGSMILDGRLIETARVTNAQRATHFTQFRLVPKNHEDLSIYEVMIEDRRGKTLDAHLMLWSEGHFEISARINDSDPRPMILAEEGIRGLGIEQREADIQRWSMREWWNIFRDSGHHPLASWSGSRIVRDTHQVAFIYEADYDVYRLYQAARNPLAGTYPLLMLRDGRVSFAEVSLDGVEEKERVSSQRMRAILGSHIPDAEPLPTCIFSAIPLWQDATPIDLSEQHSLELLRDQLEYLFQFPTLELPDPLGGTGSIKLLLGLWEMSDNDPHAEQLRSDASMQKSISLRASAGYISDIVRRELWRMKGQPANLWPGYTPKQIAESIRVALREDHYNMQGFQPKKPGDYHYDLESGIFQIVLRRRYCTHTIFLQGQQQSESTLGILTIYGHLTRDGLDPLVDYSALLQDPAWQEIDPKLAWHNAWLLAPTRENRFLWADISGQPITPVVRHMPEWHRGIPMGLFLLTTQRHQNNILNKC
jgi:hypothetical protein